MRPWHIMLKGPGIKKDKRDAILGTLGGERPFVKRGLRCFLAINHPRNAELIDKHAEAGGPESLLERHPHRSFFCQSVKDPFCLCRGADAERYGEALRFFIVLRRTVRAHQHLIAYNEPGMKDLIVPFGGYAVRHRRIPVGDHCFDFAAETLLVELERCLALAIEEQIGLHCLDRITFCGGHGFYGWRDTSCYDEPGGAARTPAANIRQTGR